MCWHGGRHMVAGMVAGEVAEMVFSKPRDVWCDAAAVDLSFDVRRLGGMGACIIAVGVMLLLWLHNSSMNLLASQ